MYLFYLENLGYSHAPPFRTDELFLDPMTFTRIAQRSAFGSSLA